MALRMASGSQDRVCQPYDQLLRSQFWEEQSRALAHEVSPPACASGTSDPHSRTSTRSGLDFVSWPPAPQGEITNLLIALHLHVSAWELMSHLSGGRLAQYIEELDGQLMP